MSIRVSATLAVLLTLVLLLVAVLLIRRSASFAALTLAMLLMTWSGEAWNTACQRTKKQLRIERQQWQKAISSALGASTLCLAQQFQFHATVDPFRHRTLVEASWPGNSSGRLTRSFCGSGPVADLLPGYLAAGLLFNSTTTISKALSPVFSGR